MMNTTSAPWSLDDIDHTLLNLALKEDLGTPLTDVTSAILLKNLTAHCTSRIYSKAKTPIVLCGTQIVTHLVQQVDATILVDFKKNDGEMVACGETVAVFQGAAQSLLMLERTLLNFLRHLSAIATLTSHYVAKTEGRCRILDTRKTTPGWRHLEKYAVYCGGGVNHRSGLYDALMIKDTHVDALGSMEQALNKLPNSLSLPVIVEVRNHSELQTVLTQRHKVNRVLLDNMDTEQLKTAVSLCQGKLATEASGNMTLNAIADVAATGVDYISVGRITYDAGHVDLSMQVQ